MTIYGITASQVDGIAQKLELVTSNVRTTKTSVSVKLDPPDSDHRYARRSWQGRRLKACSYQAFRDFILSCFASGATRVKSAMGDWRDEVAFRYDLESLWAKNIGSQVCPAMMGELSNEIVPETIVTP